MEGGGGWGASRGTTQGMLGLGKQARGFRVWDGWIGLRIQGVDWIGDP